MSDYTIHKDIERRNRYIKRHKKDLRTNDPTRAGYLSMYILWNKKSYKASLNDFKSRLNKYNKTGKFPKAITNSVLKSRFGLVAKNSKVPANVVNSKLYLKIKNKIKKQVKKKNRRWGAYDSGRLVREYKSKGGKYRGSKSKSKLDRWYKEKWVDACSWPKKKSCGRKSKGKIAYCRPSVKVNSRTPKLIQDFTKKQIENLCKKKRKSPLKRIKH